MRLKPKPEEHPQFVAGYVAGTFYGWLSGACAGGLVIGLLCLLLTACGGGGDEAEPDTHVPTPAPCAATPAGHTEACK